MWAIRRATRADVGTLVDLCRASVGPDDYVPGFLEDFLGSGIVLMAEEADAAVGMMVYHDVPDGSAWLHAARTQPAHRREGVATALMHGCEAVARRRHRTAMRLWAEAGNVASVQANRRYGFRERGRFTRLRAPATDSHGPPRLEKIPADARLWAPLRASPFLRRTGGYHYHDFYFQRLTRPVAEDLARHGALWRFGPNGISLSGGFEAGGLDLQIEPLFGSLGDILCAAPGIAASRGAERVETFLPRDPGVARIARGAGFRRMEWGRDAILFERRLRG